MVERQKNQNLLSSFDRIHFSSKTYKHKTPIKLFKELDEEFHFNFDPARPPIVGDYNENALTKRWIIKSKPKTKLRVFENPPYDRKLMERFIKKTWQEFCEGRVELAVFLLPLRATALRFLIKLKKDVEFRLVEERIKFGINCSGCSTIILPKVKFYQEKISKLFFCIKCAANKPGKMIKLDDIPGAPFDSVVAILK